MRTPPLAAFVLLCSPLPGASVHETDAGPLSGSGSCACSTGASRSSSILPTAAEPTSTTAAGRRLAENCTGPEDQEADFEDMVLIEGGRFHMGMDNPIIHGDGEGPSRPVRVSSFYLDKYTVTNSQFEDFVNRTGYVTENEKFGWSFVFETLLAPKVLARVKNAVAGAEWWVKVDGVTWRNPEGPGSDVFKDGRERHPVVQVTWNDAKAYCQWKGRRLPTEAEWEYAAVGGRSGGTLFPWGNNLKPGGVHRMNVWQGTFPTEDTGEDGWIGTSPVDAYGPQNAYGLYNMLGNVWEWVEDTWTTEHTSDEKVDPKGPPEGPEKTKKGGSFLCHKSYCYRYRSAARHHTSADSATSNNGFRCAATAPPDDED